MKKEQKDIQLIENITIKLIDHFTKKILDEETIHNTIVDDGVSRIARLANGLTSTAFTAIAIGTDNTAETTSDSTLGTEVARATATVSESPAGTAKWDYTFTFASGESYAITEAGLFDSAIASGSTMLNRVTFTAKNVDSNIDLVVSATVAFVGV